MSNLSYYIQVGHQPEGPFTADEIRAKQLPATTLIREQNETDWSTVAEKLDFRPEVHTPSGRTEVDEASQAYYLFGSFTQDLKAAALGGMGSLVVAFVDELLAIGTFAFVLEVVGLLLHFWGVYQLGKAYRLVWVQRGAKLMIASILLSVLSVMSSGFISSSLDWLSRLAGPVGTVLACVDLWPLRKVVDPRLILAVLAGHIIDEFIGVTSASSFPTLFQLLEAANIGLMAWLFYELIDRETVAESIEHTPSII